jgi:hypothetical protein
MSAFSDSCVSRELVAPTAHALDAAARQWRWLTNSAIALIVTPTARGLDAAARRWRGLTNSVFDPYRPELHYMRGPGPKWREKHARSARP